VIERKYPFLRTVAALGLLGSVFIASGCDQPSTIKAETTPSPTPEPTRPPVPTLQAVITMGPVVTRETKATSTPITKAASANEIPGTRMAVDLKLRGATPTPIQRTRKDLP